MELRTYETSDVPLWASPQLTLCAYESSAPSSHSPLLYIERLGSRPLAYKKNREWEGMNVALPQPRAQHPQQQQAQSSSSSSSSSSAPVSSGVESDITAALSSSMLNDAGFMAALRGSDEDEQHASSRVSRSRRIVADEEGLQSSQIYFAPGAAPPGGAVPGSQHGQMISAVDDNYYLRVSNATTESAPVQASASPPRASAASAVAAAPVVVVTAPIAQAQPHQPHPSPQPARSPLPPVPSPSPNSNFCDASDSEILGARLPPSKSEDSLMLPSHAAAGANQSVSPQPVSAGGGGGGGKKKKKKANKLKVAEMASGSNAASDQDE